MRVRLHLKAGGSVFVLPEEVVKIQDYFDKSEEYCLIKCRGETWDTIVAGCADDINDELNAEELKQEVIRMSRQEVMRIPKEEHTIPSTPPKFIDRGS